MSEPRRSPRGAQAGDENSVVWICVTFCVTFFLFVFKGQTKYLLLRCPKLTALPIHLNQVFLANISSLAPRVQLKGTVFLLEAVPIDNVKRVFPNLTTLFLSIFVKTASETARYLVNFCTQFPQLEHLLLPGGFWRYSSEANSDIQPNFWLLATAISQLRKLGSLSLGNFPFTDAQVRLILTGLPHLERFDAPLFSDPETFFRLAQMPQLKHLEIGVSQFPKVVELALCRDPIHFPALERLVLYDQIPPVIPIAALIAAVFAGETLPAEPVLRRTEFARLNRELALSRPKISVTTSGMVEGLVA